MNELSLLKMFDASYCSYIIFYRLTIMNKYIYYYIALSKLNFIKIKMVLRCCRWIKYFYFKFGELLKNRIFFIHFLAWGRFKKENILSSKIILYSLYGLFLHLKMSHISRVVSQMKADYVYEPTRAVLWVIYSSVLILILRR